MTENIGGGGYLLECTAKLEEGEQGNSCEFKKLFDICFFFFSLKDSAENVAFLSI